MKKSLIIRQGDCMLARVAKLPDGLAEVIDFDGILLRGESTGHAHRIADWSGAAKIAQDAIGLAGRRARLLQAADGTRFLDVAEAVSLQHEEHTAHEIPPGVYELPVQIEWTAEHARQVQD